MNLCILIQEMKRINALLYHIYFPSIPTSLTLATIDGTNTDNIPLIPTEVTLRNDMHHDHFSTPLSTTNADSDKSSKTNNITNRTDGVNIITNSISISVAIGASVSISSSASNTLITGTEFKTKLDKLLKFSSFCSKWTD